MLRIIRLPEVIRRTGKGRSSLYSDIVKGRFPRPVCLDTQSKGWIENEVGLWILERMRERDQLFEKHLSTFPLPLDQADPLRIIRLPEVIRRTGRSRSSIHLYIHKGRFPRSVRLDTRSKGWIETEIDLWIFERIRERETSYFGKQPPLSQ